MNVTLLWLLLLPIVLSIASVFIYHYVSKGEMTYGHNALVSLAAALVAALILTGAFYAGKGAKTSDTEIWNGQVTSKERVHGSYVESYQCHCHTVYSGSGKNRSSHTECDTCYRDHYTVKWDCDSTIGSFRIDSADWTSRAVYLLPDPARYTIIQKGDPVSRTHNYTNYIKAVPDSLFRPASSDLKAKYKDQIPPYPINIYDYYKVDRVIPVGVNIPNIREWNDKLSDALKTLGPLKQANAVIVITANSDPNYFFALQDAWLNGKKNDIVVVIGAPDFPHKASWVRIMALTQHDIFQVKLRDDLEALDELTVDNVIKVLTEETTSTFQRKRMRDFAYLDGEIDPPDWVMWLTGILVVIGYAVSWFLVFKNFNSSPYRRSYR
jgi:hypothetical protein